MKFSELLNEYMNVLNCTGKELSVLSGVSSSVISRYRNGEREPSLESDVLLALVKALAQIAEEKGLPDMSESDIMTAFEKVLLSKQEEYERFIKNFNILYDELNLNMKDLSAYTNFDTSFLYRIKSRERKTSDVYSFCDKLTEYLVSTYSSFEAKEKVANIIGKPFKEISDEKKYYEAIYNWLLCAPCDALSSQHLDKPSADISQFLKKLDEFDLEDYIKVIHFDKLKVPTVPFQLPTTKIYNGVKRMREGEIDFYKTVVTSKNAKSLLMCANMPMTDLAEDNDFNKKWMFAIACSIKKGLHLDMVHYLERPFEELLLGLEAWIPIYMTGQVSPWYIPDYKAHVFHHLEYISEVAVLHGECIEDAHDDGRYILTNNQADLTYYQKRAKQILKLAEPLMEIYDNKKQIEFHTFLENDATVSGERHLVLSSLPIYTMSEELLDKLLLSNEVSDSDSEHIKDYWKSEVVRMSQKLEFCTISEEISIPSKEVFEKYPMYLSVAGCFYETPILYTYEDMLKHLQETKRFADTHDNYSLNENKVSAFRNIQIEIVKDQYVIVSKIKSPSIHFVIRHPRLIQALQNFTIPVVE